MDTETKIQEAETYYRMGMLDEERWAISRRDLALFLEQPGLAEWWWSQPSTLSPEFVALVEEILGENDATLREGVPPTEELLT